MEEKYCQRINDKFGYDIKEKISKLASGKEFDEIIEIWNKIRNIARCIIFIGTECNGCNEYKNDISIYFSYEEYEKDKTHNTYTGTKFQEEFENICMKYLTKKEFSQIEAKII
jgi:hypothetical protein